MYFGFLLDSLLWVAVQVCCDWFGRSLVDLGFALCVQIWLLILLILGYGFFVSVLISDSVGCLFGVLWL